MPRAWNQAERKENCPQQNNRALHRLHLHITDGVKKEPLQSHRNRPYDLNGYPKDRRDDQLADFLQTFSED